MDQQEIGKFIAEIRKEKNMTQLELAEKLGVSDRAISKWENGRGMPNLSLLKPLCDELGITINELLSAQKRKENNQENIDENILKMIEYSNQKIKKVEKTMKIVLSIVIIVVLSFGTIYFINKKCNANNENLVSEYYLPVDLPEQEIKQIIEKYVIDSADKNSQEYNRNEKHFASARIYLIEEKRYKEIYNVYVWVKERCYQIDTMEKTGGSSIPHKFEIKKQENQYIVLDYLIPRDGKYYQEDMETYFPEEVREAMYNVYYDGTSDQLIKEMDEQVQAYFKN